MNLNDVDFGNVCKRTQSNYKSIIRRVNRELGLDPDTVDVEQLDARYREVLDAVKRCYDIKDTETFRNKVVHIVGVIKRAGLPEGGNLKYMCDNATTHLSVPCTRVPEYVEPWETLQPKLVRCSRENSNRGRVATFFAHGLPLRVAELYNTRIDKDDGVNNCVVNGSKGTELVVRVHKGKGTSGERRILLPGPVVEMVKRERERGRVWLITSKYGRRYRARSSMTLGNLDWEMQDNRTIRKSFETWNLKREKEVAEEACRSVGHSHRVARKYYDADAPGPSLAHIEIRRRDTKA